MLLHAAVAVLALGTLTSAAPPSCRPVTPTQPPVNLRFPYGQQKVRGVNLGGWLVIEPWITPSLFDNTGNGAIIDEWGFGQLQDRSVAQAALKKHWDTWITEDDFRQIAAAGLNHVRLPIGYWAYDNDPSPYIPGQAEYVDRAVEWARTHNLKIMLELHGAPGSQNGFDNSGHRLDANLQWHLQQSNIDRGTAVLNTMAKKYAGSDIVTSLGLLNEPASFRSPEVKAAIRKFWFNAYAATRFPNGQGSAQSDFLLIISDGFEPPSAYNGYMPTTPYQSVYLDTHFYTVFSPAENSWDNTGRLQAVCTIGQEYARSTTPLIVGEWSLASTDCALYLNGRGRGARYEGNYENSPRYGSCTLKTGNGDNFTTAYKTFMRQFYDIQVQTYEKYGQGWVYWCWKNENAADWSYQTGLRLGYIPDNPETHQYPLSGTCR